MDRFLEIVFAGQIMDDSVEGMKFVELFKPFLDELKDIVSEKKYSDLYDVFTDCVVDTAEYYGTKGMKLAIGIMDGSYVPQI